MGSEHSMWFSGIGMWLIPILIISVIVFLVLLFVGRLDSQSLSSNTGDKSESALDILKKRYAKDEINKDEFERMKKEMEE